MEHVLVCLVIYVETQKRRKHGYGGSAHDDSGRDCSDAITSPETAGGQKLQGAKEAPPLEHLERVWPRPHLDSRLLTSTTVGEYFFWFKLTSLCQFVTQT